MELRTYDIKNTGEIKIHGRTDGSYPLTLYYTASGIEMNVSGSELYINFRVKRSDFEPWVAIIADGVPISRFMVANGDSRVCIFRRMNDSTFKNIRIIKETQPLDDELLQIVSVESNGEFAPVADKKIKIEFIGDSITSGEGAIGAACERDWIPMWFSAVNDYAYMTAQRLDADYRVCSQSGWGVYSNWCNNTNQNIPSIYEKVCGVSANPEAKADYDFSSFKPDIVSIYLGANDSSAFNQPEWVDENGVPHKLRLRDDGQPEKDSLEKVEGAVREFLKTVRRHNPESYIFWICGGMAGEFLTPMIKSVIADFQINDKKTDLITLPPLPDGMLGALSHPSVRAHEWMTEFITKRFAAVL